MPPFHIRFRSFTSLNTTIRLRDGQLTVNLSDLLHEAPNPVLEAIAHILVAKLYRKPISAAQNNIYRAYTGSPEISRRAEEVRQQRGRKRVLSAKGKVYDLDEVFDTVNAQFFEGRLSKPTLTWSGHSARRLLGHYDAAHNTIVVSRIFDRPQVPQFAIDYLMYHEMLHLKHPVRMNGSRRCVHSREFKRDEAKFPDFEEVKAYLKRL